MTIFATIYTKQYTSIQIYIYIYMIKRQKDKIINKFCK